MQYILIVSNRKNIKENKTYPQSYQLDTNSWFIFFFSSPPPPISLQAYSSAIIELSWGTYYYTVYITEYYIITQHAVEMRPLF